MKIKWKIVIPMVIITVIAAAAVLITNIVIFSSYAERTNETTLANTSSAVIDKIEQLKTIAAAASTGIASDDAIAGALESGDRNAAITRGKALQDSLGLEFITITDTEGNVFVRTHEPEKFGDSVAKQANIASALTGKALTAVEPGSAVKLSVRSGVPVYNSEKKLIGVVSSGFRLDQDNFVDGVKQSMGLDAAVTLQNTVISSTIGDGKGGRLIDVPIDPDIAGKVLGGTPVTAAADVGGKSCLVHYQPLIDTATSETVGMLAIYQPQAEKDGAVTNFVLIGLLIIVILLAVTVPTVFYLAKRIVDPLRKMVSAAERLADGDVDVKVEVTTRDETAMLAEAFNKMIGHSREQAAVITDIARGDLSAVIKPCGEKDAVGQALAAMLDINNEVFSHISDAAAQVDMGAQQVAQGAQALAQSNTEQASTIESLSQSISSISEQTGQNAEMAKRAAELGDSIRESAETGNDQMNQMIAAVDEINQASTSISHVIKVIDDIAFQTNILALNAAVEAARAGQHGKGFAVVAEEVRNLAGKSAIAAKDTAQLIENSMEKAGLGTRIAKETAESLSGIVSGIRDTMEIVDRIASSSVEQSAAIDQINHGVSQVSSVVMVNSASSEQTAAASEEMSAQAEMLAQLVSRFKLRG